MEHLAFIDGSDGAREFEVVKRMHNRRSQLIGCGEVDAKMARRPPFDLGDELLLTRLAVGDALDEDEDGLALPSLSVLLVRR